MRPIRLELFSALLILCLLIGCQKPPSPAGVTPTAAAAPTTTPAPTATPVTHTPYSEVEVAPYTLTNWQPIWATNVTMYGYVTIERDATVLLTIPGAVAITPLPQGDINGDGAPDVLIQRRTGGSHCCSHTNLYSLGAEPHLIFEISQSINSDGGLIEVRDLDGDGVPELLTHDSLDNERQLCTPPTVPVVLALTAAGAYAPAGDRFPDYYSEQIDLLIERLEDAPAQPDARRCWALGLAGAYYYSGRPEKGLSVLNEWLPGETELIAQIIGLIESGRFYGLP